MYPFSAIAIGCDEDLVQTLRAELTANLVRLEAEFSRVETALALLNTGLPDGYHRLFLLKVGDPSGISHLIKLSGAFPGHPIVALIPNTADPNLVIRIMRQGATQVVMLPLQPDDFRVTLDCLAKQYGLIDAHRPVVAVASAHGGSGATTIALNIAGELASQHATPAILVELALRMGVLATYLDVEPRYTTHDLLASPGPIDADVLGQALTPISENLQLLSGPYHSIEPMEVAPAEVLALLDQLRILSKGVILLDVPCTFDELYFQTLAASTMMILVGEQKVPSIRALLMVTNTLDRNEVNVPRLIVINKYDPKIVGFRADDLAKLLGVTAVRTIGRDPAVRESVDAGCLLRKHAPRSPVLADIEQLARAVLGRPEEAPKRSKSAFLGRLGAVLGLKGRSAT